MRYSLSKNRSLIKYSKGTNPSDLDIGSFLLPYPKFAPLDATSLTTADGSVFYVPLNLLVVPTDADNFVTSDGYTLYTYSSS